MKPRNKNWSHNQDKKMLISTTGKLKLIHVAKFNPNSEPYKLYTTPHELLSFPKTALNIFINGTIVASNG